MNNNNLINYYCDESCYLERDRKKFMAIGYVSIPYTRIKRYKDDIKSLRIKHNNFFEVKWTKLTKWNYQFYTDLISLFFDREDFNFRAILVDKNRYIAQKSDNDYDKFYYLMYYQLIYHKLDSISKKYNIYLDIKDDLSTYRIVDLKRILNVNMGVIEKIQHIRSHESEFIQICDLLIGAITYTNNEAEGSSEPKLKLINKIKSLSKCDLTNQTPKSSTKFNLFRIQI